MIVGNGNTTGTFSDNDVRQILAQALDPLRLTGKRVLVIIPDGTRTAPIPLIFRLLYEQIGWRAAQLDYLIALGTHPPMPAPAIDKLVGVSAPERAAAYPNVQIFNHAWDHPDALATIGAISADEMAALTDGLMTTATPVRINRAIFDYDQIVICGPVFPHEVVGFSGGAKYLFPGIAGAAIIDATHWLGALATSMATIGVKDTAVRRVIHRAAEFVDRPLLCLALVLCGAELHGLYAGEHSAAWHAAADLSAQLNIIYVDRPFQQVLSMPSERYADLWTAAKAMYKTEPVIADGGEVIIYAPHITEVSYTHGRLLDEIGYHIRDYFLQQWERFAHMPGAILAHSTHVKGSGRFDLAGGEVPRIQVSLATGIPAERCRQINLGYIDYRDIDPHSWAGREDEGILLVQHAGEMLYRLRADATPGK
ncbi:MAG: lactate racemase domain-containing protein [Chloroflexales bacterium]|nr:lactate racemase domain-containing protein [Chloroflexales bacterium]